MIISANQINFAAPSATKADDKQHQPRGRITIEERSTDNAIISTKSTNSDDCERRRSEKEFIGNNYLTFSSAKPDGKPPAKPGKIAKTALGHDANGAVDSPVVGGMGQAGNERDGMEHAVKECDETAQPEEKRDDEVDGRSNGGNGGKSSGIDLRSKKEEGGFWGYDLFELSDSAEVCAIL